MIGALFICNAFLIAGRLKNNIQHFQLQLVFFKLTNLIIRLSNDLKNDKDNKKGDMGRKIKIRRGAEGFKEKDDLRYFLFNDISRSMPKIHIKNDNKLERV